MSKDTDEKVVKEIVEYANNEIKKSKKKHLMILILVLASIILLSTALFFMFTYERSVSYSEDLFDVGISVDKFLIIKVNQPYKNAKAMLVQVDENTYDLFINVSRTLSTKILNDNDKSNDFLKVVNLMVIDYQSGEILTLWSLVPEDLSNIRNIYYAENFTNENIMNNDGILVWTNNSQPE